jgi:3-methyladenine DNA glycosylase AlkD
VTDKLKVRAPLPNRQSPIINRQSLNPLIPMTPTAILAWLKRHGSQRNVRGMARYGIVARHAFGVPMSTLNPLGKRLGTDYALATALWESGCYEARLLAALVGDPVHVTSRQMDAWAASFESCT